MCVRQGCQAEASTHPSITLGIDEDHVVSSMVVPRVYQHRMEDISGWCGVWLLQELVHIEFLWELVPVGFWSECLECMCVFLFVSVECVMCV